MARQCAVIPKVLNRRGEKKDSRLFKDLLSYLSNRTDAVRVYLTTKNSDFIRDWYPRLIIDDNNEPTLRSLIKETDVKSMVDEAKIIENLNRDIGYYKKGSHTPALIPDTYENLDTLVKKAIGFNNNSDFSDEYVARVYKALDDSKSSLGIRIEKRNRDNSSEAKRMEYNHNLNKKLRSILREKSIGTGALTELERRLGINGVTDFSQAEKAAEGIVKLIRLAEGTRGEEALPEEFAHFAVEALGSDNPLVNRLINLIVSNNLASEILGEEYNSYTVQYNGDETRLAREAAGKLLAKHLLNNEEIAPKPYRNLLQRLIASIKNFFKGMSASSIQRAMMDADTTAGSIAGEILYGDLAEDMDMSNISVRDQLFNLNERVQRDKNLLQKIIDQELKRLKIYEKRTKNPSFESSQEALITQLESDLRLNNTVEGIYSFIGNSLSILEQLDRKIASLKGASGVPINEKAKILRDIRNYLYSYKPIIEDIRKALVEEEGFNDNRYGQRVRESLDKLSNLMGDLYVKYDNEAMPLFVNFIKTFIGDGIKIPYGKKKGQVITAEELVKRAESDISFCDRWLDSMADSSSYILKIMDQAVKKTKTNARLRTIQTIKRIQAAGIKLEQAGIKDTDWMFERDSDGKLTGKYISDRDYGSYAKAKDEMFDRLIKKYGENPIGDDLTAFNNEASQWYKENLDPDGKPKRSIYGNPAYENLSDAQKDYYKEIMAIKKELDSCLPEKYTYLRNAVKIRKDLVERIKSSDNPKQGLKQIWENIKDQFVRRGDDTEIADKATMTDFEEHQVQVLPIYFTRLREGESMDDLSTDVTSTMGAYASMAIDYDEMGKVIDILELGRDMLRDHLRPNETQGDLTLKEKFEVLGRKVENTVLRPTDKRRIIERLDDYFEMQVYNRYIADEGTFGKTGIDKAKTADFVNRMTALNSLALNILSGVSNVATGKVMMRIESMSKEFFTEKDTIIADRIYAGEMPSFLAEVGNRVQVSKISLWTELFDVLQDFESSTRELNFNRKTWFSRMFKSSALFFINNAGEHWMQLRTSLALANRYKMKDPDGNTVSLWDAMEVVYIDPNNKALGAELKIKKGYTKEDGTEFTKEDIHAFSRRAAAINQRMHGIYNRLDRSAVQRLAVGRLGVMYRKWIKPSLNRRWKSAGYNFDLQEWAEGYYRTTARFLWQVAKELKEGKFALIANFNNLDPREKKNIIRAATEIGHLLAIALILGLIEWPDDKDRPWATKMAEYQLRRLYTEIGAFVPGPQFAREALRILKSPAAGVNTLEGTLNLVGLLNPYNYETFGGEEALLQSGRYEGESRAVRLFYESPILPMNRTIYRGLHPEDGIPFFKQ